MLLLLRRLAVIALLALPGAFVVVAVAWIARELGVRERRQSWERRFRDWFRQPPGGWQRPSPQP